MIEVNLTSYEMMIAAQVGVTRQISNLQKGRKDFYGAKERDGWRMHIEGCMGEMAVAKALGLFWNGDIGDLGAPDVDGLEVRTSSRLDGDLIMHPRDKDNAYYILVTGVNGRYQIHGYIEGRYGKNEKYWSDPAGGRPAFFVPQSVLNPIEFLVEKRPDYIQSSEW